MQFLMTLRRLDVQKLLIKLNIANNFFKDIVTSTGPHDGHGRVVGGAGGQLAAQDGDWLLES